MYAVADARCRERTPARSRHRTSRVLLVTSWRRVITALVAGAVQCVHLAPPVVESGSSVLRCGDSLPVPKSLPAHFIACPPTVTALSQGLGPAGPQTDHREASYGYSSGARPPTRAGLVWERANSRYSPMSWARMAPVPFLLLIEDDDAIRTALELSLTRQGHRVVTAATGEDGLKLLREQRPDLIVLDVMLPGIDGFEVCRRIRRTDQLPIILLTARSDDIDVVVGLESGADDYVVKPVQGRVLDARIRAVLRRGERESNDSATFGSLVIDRSAMTVTKNGEDLQLTPDRAAAAAGAEPPARAGAVPPAVAAAGVGARLPRRLAAGGRLCAAAAREGGGRAVLADPDPYGPRRRLPAGLPSVTKPQDSSAAGPRRARRCWRACAGRACGCGWSSSSRWSR